MNRRSFFGLGAGAVAAAALSIGDNSASASTRRLGRTSCTWPAMRPEDAEYYVSHMFAAHDLYDPRRPRGGGLLDTASAMTSAEWDQLESEFA